ncbi:MAG: hypothetical protein NC093_08965 [Alistipes sp.]|nr:hypothetical protein [Alistipes sp.]
MPKWTDNPWERQKGESEKAYEAFANYRDMGENRTDVAVANKLRKSCTLIRRWKKLWDWAERVRAYDNWLEKSARQKIVKNRQDMIDRHIRIAKDLQGKALSALQNADLDEMSFKDIREVLKMATELERITQGMAEVESTPKEQESRTSFADIITSAYQKRKNSDDNE